MAHTLSSEPQIISTPNEYRLASPPADGISSVQFTPDANSKLLLAASWDCTVRLYDVGTSATHNTQRCAYTHASAALGCTFLDAVRCASGGLDNVVKMYDLNSGTETVMGTHSEAVRCVEFVRDIGTLASGSWDRTVKLWDPRMQCATGTHQQPQRVYAMSSSGMRLIVGTAERHILVWDVRNMNEPEQRRESSLRYQTRCIRAFPNRDGFVVSSIEGRVAVEFFDMDPEKQKKKYAFKCHRGKEDGEEYIYPVNAIAFHPLYNSFATGGSDALVNVWDPFNKKRLCQFHKYPTSISSLAFNNDGSLLAIAASYQYENGPKEPDPVPDNTIFIRKVTDQETKPKH